MHTRRSALQAIAAATATGVALGSGILPALAQDAPSPDDVFKDTLIPYLGNPDGDVTIVEFFDYQCPYCKKNYPTLKDAVAADGNVKLLMRDWPIFGNPSVYASQLVLGQAGKPSYDTAHEALMDTRAKLSVKEIDARLKKAGLDPKAMLDDYMKKQEEVDLVLQKDNAIATALRLRGTPGYVIGRKIYGGVLERSGFEQAIAEARDTAKKG